MLLEFRNIEVDVSYLRSERFNVNHD